MKFLVYAALTLLLAACATASMSPSSETYLRRTMAFPLQFAVPNKHAEIASGRAQSFVGRFGTMKLQVATDYVVPTYNPDGAGDYAYYGTRTPGRSVAVFDVGCQTGGTFEGEEARQNAHIFAFYVKTGLMPPEFSLIAPN